jgi:hypothetical protein
MQIKRQVLLLLVNFPQNLLLLRYHRQHLHNRQPNHLSVLPRKPPKKYQQQYQKQRLCFSKIKPERERVHLGELVGCTAGDLGDAEEGKIRFKILELVQQLGLRFLTQLMDLDSCCDIFTNKNVRTQKLEAKLKRDFRKHRKP